MTEISLIVTLNKQFNSTQLSFLTDGRCDKGPFTPETRLIGESVCWSKIQRGMVGPALRGRGERDKFFQPVEKWSGMIPLSTGRMLSGGTAWLSAVQRRLVIF